MLLQHIYFFFVFQGIPLNRNRHVIREGNKITLLDLRHSDSGLYTCVASNEEGDGQSNAINLNIQRKSIINPFMPNDS